MKTRRRNRECHSQMTSISKEYEISTQTERQWTGSCSEEPGNSKLDPLPCVSDMWGHEQCPLKTAAGKWFHLTREEQSILFQLRS